MENLFNSNISKQIAGMKELEKNVLTGTFFENMSSGSEGGHAPANFILDLLLKWCSYRLSLQPHPQATNQLLKTIGSLCDVAKKTSNRLEDFEADSIIPSLIERGFGNSKARVRTQFRSILRRFCHLYPASKIAEAVRSVRARSARISIISLVFTRISLVHTTRKSLEQQRLNVHSNITKT